MSGKSKFIENFNIRYPQLLEFYTQNKRLPYPRENYKFNDGTSVTNYINYLRHAFKNNKLDEKHINLLNNLEITWAFKPTFLQIPMYIEELCKYYELNNKHAKWNDTQKFSNGVLMYRGICLLRNYYKENLLTENQIQQLKSISLDITLTYEKILLIHVNELVSFYQIHGRYPIKNERIIFSDGTYMENAILDIRKKERNNTLSTNIKQKLLDNNFDFSPNTTNTSIPEQYIFIVLNKSIPSLINPYYIASREFDMYSSLLGLGIMYDGYVWHQDPAADDKVNDIFFENDGKILIRIREDGCPPLKYIPGLHIIHTTSNYSEKTLKNCLEEIKDILIKENIIFSLFHEENDFNNAVINSKKNKTKTWFYKFNLLLNFIETNGEAPTLKNDSLFYDSTSIYHWYSKLKKSKRKNQLCDEQLKALDLLDNYVIWDYSFHNLFNIHINELTILIKTYGSIKDVPSNIVFSTKTIVSTFYKKIREAIKNGRLTPNEISKLKKINFILDKTSSHLFEYRFKEYIEFRKKNGFFPVSDDTNSKFSDGTLIGSFTKNIKVLFKNNTLSEFYVSQLRYLDFKFDHPFNITMEKHSTEFKKLLTKYSSINELLKYHSTFSDGVKIKKWVSHRKEDYKKGKLPSILNDINNVFAPQDNKT